MEWTTLDELRKGAIFETRDGIRAVKSEYHYTGGQCECVLLESGEYAHFPNGNREEVREIIADTASWMAAVESERERCAKVADEARWDRLASEDMMDIWKMACKVIAIRIREGTP